MKKAREDKIHFLRDFEKPWGGDPCIGPLTLCGLEARGRKTADLNEEIKQCLEQVTCGNCRRVLDEADRDNKLIDGRDAVIDEIAMYDAVIDEIAMYAKRKKSVNVPAFTFERWRRAIRAARQFIADAISARAKAVR